MSENLQKLKDRMRQLSRLGEVAAIVSWDQNTYMPSGAANARAEQASTLSAFTHELFTSDLTGDLLAKSEADTVGMNEDSDERRMLSNLRRDFDKATKLPADLVADLAHHSSIAQEIWISARKENSFASFAPALEKMFDLTRRQAECLGYKDHIYDALIDLYEPGARQAEVATMFADMKPSLVALNHAISESKNPVDDSILHRSFPVATQREFTLKAAAQFGYDLNHGRQDEAPHPFCTSFSRDDVRITTRFDPNFFSMAFYGTLHETGHALYEQGVPAEFEQTPIGGATSLGIHESQSRMWENMVGRSRSYAQFIFPQLQTAYPEAYRGSTSEAYYRAVNKVSPSLIRVEADEVTYNLHILLRFELECELLTEKLAIKDLPEAWNSRMEEYLGITPDSDANGCLQDVHWSCGLVGYFPTYSIGNLVSGQLWNSIKKVHSDIDAQFAKGEFANLLSWLRQNVHSKGSKYLPKELVEMATGEKLTSKYYMDYLQAKYKDIYSL